jgi:type VI secretion system secreted protein VgrG
MELNVTEIVDRGKRRTTMKMIERAALLLAILTAGSLSYADTILGAAASFGVMGASTVTNTGPSVINGDSGLYPGLSITGFPPGTVNGTIYVGDAIAEQAQADALTAYNVLAGMPPNGSLTGQDLGGLTLTPGGYQFDDSAGLTGTLTLDFQGLSNQTFVFQIGSTLTTASASSVLIINPGANDSVYWQVGSSATLGTTTAFYGTIIADASITLNTGATIACGNALALNGAVTMDTNTVSVGACAVPDTDTPEPSTVLLVAAGLIAGAAWFKRAKPHRER